MRASGEPLTARTVDEQIAVRIAAAQRIDHRAHAERGEILRADLARLAGRNQAQARDAGVVEDLLDAERGMVEIVDQAAFGSASTPSAVCCAGWRTSQSISSAVFASSNANAAARLRATKLPPEPVTDRRDQGHEIVGCRRARADACGFRGTHRPVRAPIRRDGSGGALRAVRVRQRMRLDDARDRAAARVRCARSRGRDRRGRSSGSGLAAVVGAHAHQLQREPVRRRIRRQHAERPA